MSETSEDQAPNKCSLFEGVVLTSVVVVVIGLFSIPRVVYLSNRKEASLDWKSLVFGLYPAIAGNNTVTQLMSEDSLANCSALTTSNLCYKHIQCMLQRAKGEETANSSAPIYVTSLVDGSAISQYQSIINNNLSPQCRDHGLPLYCRYLYSPCTEESEEFALTREECNVLTNDICVGEFRRLKQILTISKLEYLPLVPTCNELQSGGINHTDVTITGRFNRTTAEVVCHPDYVKIGELCLFSCSRPIDMPAVPGINYPPNDLFQCFFLSIVVIFSAIFIVLSVVKRKELLKFPTILLLYSNVFQMLGVIIVLIGYVWGQDLYCSHPDVLHTFQSSPTPSCSAVGFFFLFSIMSTYSMWVLHLGYIVVLLMFPFYGEHTLKKKTTLIHIISVPITLLLSFIPSIVAMAAGGYSIHTFPPVVCMPANTDLTYYTLSLPASVIMCTMTILCILLFYLIHKNSRQKASMAGMSTSKKKMFFSVPEIKILLIAIMMVIFAVSILGRFSYTLISVDEYSRLVVRDGLCHLHGDNSGANCAQRNYLVAQAVTAMLTYIIACLVPITYVIFVASLSDSKKVKEFCCAWKNRKSKNKSNLKRGGTPNENNNSKPRVVKNGTPNPDCNGDA